jgi:hypothetical protein
MPGQFQRPLLIRRSVGHAGRGQLITPARVRVPWGDGRSPRLTSLRVEDLALAATTNVLPERAGSLKRLGISADWLEWLARKLCYRLPLATALDALIAGDDTSDCAAEGCDIVLVHDDFGRSALWALRDTVIDHHRPPCTDVLGCVQTTP